MNTLRLTLNPLEKKSHINPEIYGNFSEHLGRCIYDGIYVGETATFPTQRASAPTSSTHSDR